MFIIYILIELAKIHILIYNRWKVLVRCLQKKLIKLSKKLIKTEKNERFFCFFFIIFVLILFNFTIDGKFLKAPHQNFPSMVKLNEKYDFEQKTYSFMGVTGLKKTLKLKYSKILYFSLKKSYNIKQSYQLITSFKE